MKRFQNIPEEISVELDEYNNFITKDFIGDGSNQSEIKGKYYVSYMKYDDEDKRIIICDKGDSEAQPVIFMGGDRVIDRNIIRHDKLEVLTFNWEYINEIQNIYQTVRVKIGDVIIPEIFSDATPEQIRYASMNNMIPETWEVGDTAMIPINEVDVEFRIADMTPGRYQRTDGNGFSNIVLEMTGIYEERPWNDTSNDNTYVPSSLRAYLNDDVNGLLSLLPQKWRDNISEVNIPTATAGSQTGGNIIQELPHKLFLMSEIEVYGVINRSHPGEGTVYEYYDGIANSFRIKQYNGNNTTWWLRSPYSHTYGDGSIVYNFNIVDHPIATNTTNSVGVSACLAF